MICSNETTRNDKPLIHKYINNIAIQISGIMRKNPKTFQLEAQPADKENTCVDLYFKVKEESPAEQITDQIINILTGEH